MRTIDVRNKEDLKALFPVLTKKNTIWKNRINWNDIQVEGTSIVTHFGTFTFIKAEKVNKVWYWTLKDNNKTFRVKREQCRRNKRTPKNIEVIKPNTFTFKYQLCLPAPKEVIDILVEEANKIAHIKNVETWEDIEEEIKEDIQDGCVITDLDIFRDKTRFAYKHLNVKRVYRELAKKYHPDKSKTNEEYFEIVNGLYNIYNK